MKLLFWFGIFILIIDTVIISFCLLGTLGGSALVGNMLAALGHVPPYYFISGFITPSLAGVLNIALIYPLLSFIRKQYYKEIKV